MIARFICWWKGHRIVLHKSFPPESLIDDIYRCERCGYTSDFCE